MAVPWNEQNAAHLLRRTGFGVRPDEIERALDEGFDATIEARFTAPRKRRKPKGPIHLLVLEDLQAWWLNLMIRSSSPLTEKATLMWHNHFATAFFKIDDAELMHLQNLTLGRHALGNFREMTHALAKDPAMLVWLDNEANIAADPNENFARELMELFTTGVFDQDGLPNYTEQDVVEAARAFTGWTREGTEFVFDADQHDFGTKSFRGLTGNLDGGDVIDQLVLDPATARRVAWRIYTFFARQVDLDDPVLDPLAQAYLDSDTDLRPVMETLFRSDGFYSAEVRGARVKSPAELLAGTLRMLGAKLRINRFLIYDISALVVSLGQSLFDPPSVFGWKEGRAWLSSNGVLQRIRMADQVADARKSWIRWKPKKVLGKKKDLKGADAALVLDRLVAVLGSPALQTSTREALLDYLVADENGFPGIFTLDSHAIDAKVRGAVALIVSAPEYQFD